MADRCTEVHIIWGILFIIVLKGIFTPASTYSKTSALHTLQAQTSYPPEDSQPVIILPASVKAIVNFTEFKLTQEFLLVLGLAFSIILIFRASPCRKPLFRISYLHNTFCHHIAINAP